MNILQKLKDRLLGYPRVTTMYDVVTPDTFGNFYRVKGPYISRAMAQISYIDLVEQHPLTAFVVREIK